MFRDRTVEMTETAEEAVVAKEARVKEELVVSKTASQRTKQVHTRSGTPKWTWIRGRPELIGPAQSGSRSVRLRQEPLSGQPLKRRAPLTGRSFSCS
ncbi:hypothetical protein ACFQPG_10860 [Sphingomonas sp. GCM10030256]|uniref:hypothetical protein n=1 Tax=Sphingomonas sp. GCM10030256 TaxID=3273427 RepID=UPI00361DB1FD